MSRRESSTSPQADPADGPPTVRRPHPPLHPYLPTSGSVSHTRRSFAPSTARKSMRPSEGTRRTITGRPHRTSVQRVGGLRFAATGTGYYGLHVEGDDGGTSMASAHSFLTTAVAVRDSYKEMDGGKVESPERLTPPIGLRLEDGIFYFSDQCTPVVPWEKYYEDLQTLIQCIQHPRVNAACEHRLQVMEEQFNVYRIFNQEMEESADRYRRGGGVFSDAVKVDNFVKLPYSMSAPWLVSYIRERMEEQGEDVVAMQGDGFKREPINLSKVCTLLEFNDPDWVSVEGLGLQPMLDRRRLTRVDITDPEFNSAGRQSATLLQLFLSPYTVNKGAYLADAVRVVLEANEELERGPRATETLVEISGLQEEEWERLAEWMYEQDLLETYRTNRWLISISPSPPIVGKGTEGSTTENTFEIGPKFNTSLENHQQQLENIFLPLFQATVAPEDAKNVHVAGLLANVGAFVVQCGDAPGRRPLSAKRRRPVDVPWSEKVPVSYFLYYVWTNLSALNALRKRCGLNTIQLRTKLSSQSSPEALAVSYMLCDHIIDGTALEAHPAMQYLFGLHRIGVCMSPTYSNALGGVPYIENPFAKFFRRGLRVSLATFAPLLTHTSSEPLTEEYGNVARVCRLSGVDLSEIGLNSAWISSFPDELKSEWLGSDVGQQDWRGNNVEFTNVPTARLELRSRVWTAERNVLRRCEGLEPLSGSDSDDELTSAAVGQDGKRKSDSHFKGGTPLRRHGPSTSTSSANSDWTLTTAKAHEG
ncbi:adenosine monophosphate deaminase [Angomonas deanei]|nr:adenosine monophosphate deaminase [Angomonas deanei]|eukprot:EPY42817.1 adenosine monophosphate deaminase [Angomonas deanei]